MMSFREFEAAFGPTRKSRLVMSSLRSDLRVRTPSPRWASLLLWLLLLSPSSQLSLLLITTIYSHIYHAVHLRSCRKQTQSHARQSNRLASGYKTLTNNYKSTVSSSTSPDTVVAAIRKDAEPRGTTDTSSRPSPTPEDSSVAEVTTAWPSEKPGKQVKLWTMYPCPHCDKVRVWLELCQELNLT